MNKADIGLIGLAVMGQNLILNFNDHGYVVAAYNRTSSKTKGFINGVAKDTKVIACYALEDFVNCLVSPRKIILMIQAGPAVDAVIAQLLPLLKANDIIIDGGNSRYLDSNRRCQALADKHILFLGCGISGGEEGARFGPSMMPGGNIKAWPQVQQMLQSIAAKVDQVPCCQWVGDKGAGHYVKMVHNGIEYGDMQLICEAYLLMREGLGLSVEQCHTIFSTWNDGLLKSYLIEITAKIMQVNDPDGSPLIDKILDVAGQKGTGSWTGISALELGMPLTLITEAVFARCLSAQKKQRVAAAKLYQHQYQRLTVDKEEAIQQIHDALYAAKMISYVQGFMLMKEASNEYQWQLDFGAVALMWRGGCIIRSVFLNDIKSAYEHNPALENLLMDDYFKKQITSVEKGLRNTVVMGLQSAYPIPAMSAALTFFDGFRCAKLPANLLQAQRDFFGAHTYRRTDKADDISFHTDWEG